MSSASTSGSGTDPLTVPAGGSAVLPVSSAVTISSSSSSGVGISTPAGHSGPLLAGSSDNVVHPVSYFAISDADLRRLAEAVATVISRSPAGTLGPGTSGSGKIRIYKWSGSHHACTIVGAPRPSQHSSDTHACRDLLQRLLCFHKAA